MRRHETATAFQWADVPKPFTEPVLVQRGSVAWRVEAGWREILLGPDAPDWFALEDDARAVAVKPGYLRKIWRVDLSPCIVFAKVVHPARGLAGWLQRAATNSALREWRAGRAAQARGVPAVHPLALGVRKGPGRASVLLSEELAESTRLSDYWCRQVEPALPIIRRARSLRLIAAVSRLLATAHEKGFLHGDAHPDNILVTSPSNGDLDLHFVDLASARFLSGPVPWRLSLRSLAELEPFFQDRTTRTQRFRFFRQYLALRTTDLDPRGGRTRLKEAVTSVERRLWPRVAKAIARHQAQLVRQRDRRLRRHGKYFTTLNLGHGWKATVVLQLERRHRFPEPDVPDWTETRWRSLFASLLPILQGLPVARDNLEQDGLLVEIHRPQRTLISAVSWAHRRQFETGHRRRHRNQTSELILAHAWRRRRGMIDMTLLLRPT